MSLSGDDKLFQRLADELKRHGGTNRDIWDYAVAAFDSMNAEGWTFIPPEDTSRIANDLRGIAMEFE